MRTMAAERSPATFPLVGAHDRVQGFLDEGGGGTEWEQRGALNRTEPSRTGLSRAHRLGVTCGPSCWCWSRRCGPFVDLEALNGAQRTSTAVYQP